MYEISDLRSDYEFLQKYKEMHKEWEACTSNPANSLLSGPPVKPKIRKSHKTNFLLHPKRLISDSEDTSPFESPRKPRNTERSQQEPSFPLSRRILEKLQQETQVIPDPEIESIGDCCRKSSQKAASEIDESEKPGNEVKHGIPGGNQKKTGNTSTRVKSAASRIETNVDKKIKTLIEKTIKCLGDIRNIMTQGIEPCDGQEDFVRKSKRAQEYSSRLSRVYLYPIGRLMTELTAAEQEKLSQTQTHQKIVQIYNLIYQALHSYLNYLPNAVGNCCSDKIKTLMEQCLDLCQFQGGGLKKSPENCEFLNALQNHAELLLETVTTFEQKFLETLKKCRDAEKKKVPKQLQPKMRSRLSMYAVTASFRKDSDWKRAVENLARKKYNVKSRYRTANFKHRPPPQECVSKPHVLTLPSRARLFPKRSSGCIRDTPIKSPLREDDIETMVGAGNENLQVPVNSTIEVVNHEKSFMAAGGDETPPPLLMAHTENADFQCADEEIPEKQDEKIPKNSEVEDIKSTTTKSYKKPIITISGAKNARLICIRDDNSLVEISSSSEKSPPRQNPELLANLKLKSSETQTDFRRSGSCMKISRLPKHYKLLKPLLREQAIGIIQYKLEYSEFQKPNPMYRKSANIQPWILMGEISDEILEQLIETVTGELELSDILENLYNAEFQY